MKKRIRLVTIFLLVLFTLLQLEIVSTQFTGIHFSTEAAAKGRESGELYLTKFGKNLEVTVLVPDGMNEIELRNQLYGLVKNKCDERDFHYEIRDIQTILEDDLFKTFMDKLEQTDYEEEKKKQMRDIAIKAMTEARA